MPCVQAPKNQPPANAKGGPFDTEQECKESVGTAGGCPCCSNNDCPKCYCIERVGKFDGDTGRYDCPGGYSSPQGDDFYIDPTGCYKITPDLDCNLASCVAGFPGGQASLHKYYCCCQKTCVAPSSSHPFSGFCQEVRVSRPGWRVEGFNSREECLAGGNRTEQDCDKLYYFCEQELPPNLINP